MSPSVDTKNWRGEPNVCKENEKNKNKIAENNFVPTKCACGSTKTNKVTSKYGRSLSECDISYKKSVSANNLRRIKKRGDTLGSVDQLGSKENKESVNKSAYSRLLCYLKRLKRTISK